jgi:hypothetical protein
VATVEAFLVCQTQWHIDVTSSLAGTSSKVRGLRYADVAATLDLLEVPNRRDVFEGIRTMERAALAVFNPETATTK